MASAMIGMLGHLAAGYERREAARLAWNEMLSEQSAIGSPPQFAPEEEHSVACVSGATVQVAVVRGPR